MKVVSFPRLERSDAVSFEEQLEQAYQDGLAEGIKQGFDKGQVYGQEQAQETHQQHMQQLQKELNSQLKQQYQSQFEAMKKGLQRQQKSVKEQLQHAVVTLIEQLAKHTLSAELQDNKRHLAQAVQEIMPELDAVDPLQQVYVSESDISFWQQFDLSAFAPLTLHCDPELVAGQVQFVGKTQLFELDFTRKLEQLLEQLKIDLEQDSAAVTA